MFDPDKEITAWTASLADRCGRAEIVAELEDHLRTDVERLTAEGLSAEQAFRSATARIGSQAALDAEYDKGLSLPGRAHRWLSRVERRGSRASRRSRGRLARSLLGAALVIAAAVVLSDLGIPQAGAYLLAVFVPLGLVVGGVLERG